MTYFSYQHVRGQRGEGVYAGSILIGRVVIKANWRSRLSLGPNVEFYCAVGLGGDALPGLFRARHDAAEALHAVARGTAGTGEDTAVRLFPSEGLRLDGKLLGGR